MTWLDEEALLKSVNGLKTVGGSSPSASVIGELPEWLLEQFAKLWSRKRLEGSNPSFSAHLITKTDE